VAPEVADALREASLDAFDEIVDLTIARGAAFLLIAGDVYDGAERGVRAQLRFRAGLARLSERNIPTFVVHGNHDPVETGWSAITNGWPAGVVVFGSGEVEVVPVEQDGIEIATVQGISYSRPAETENLAKRLGRPARDGFAVGVLHCNVEGSPETYAPYSPCTVTDLLDTGLDYLALGHIHERRILAGRPGQNGWVVYPGNSQARSPKRSEHGAKGAVVVTVSAGVVDEVEFVACDTVRFDTIECPIDDLDDLGSLEDELVRQAEIRLDESEGRSIVLRARLTGRGPIHGDLARPGTVDEICKALRDRAATRVPFIWWDELADASTSAIDLDEIRDRGDFAADLVDVADALFADATDLESILGRVAAQAPRSLQRDLAAVMQSPGWIADEAPRATMVALDVLLSEES
jgi:DNA repair exonuclease SbcCD nuclease subunit